MPVTSLRTPVALVIFNRPDYTARVLDGIAAAKPPRLYVIADGPRTDHPDDERLVSEARAVIDRVDWPCELHTCYSDVNLNCHRRIASGLDWLFANEPEAIILEDDCLPDPSFFPYCEQLLERYRDDERVHMISGSTSTGARGNAYSYRFSKCYSVWGWASWARAWKHYDADMRAWPVLRETRWLEQHLGDRKASMLAETWFDGAYAGPIQQWDFKWMFGSWLRNAVAVAPSVNLVTNIGFGEGATHLRNANHPFAEIPAESMEFPLRHPPRVEVDDRVDRAMWDVVIERFMRARRSRLRPLIARFPNGVRRLRAFVRARRAAPQEGPVGSR
jgi:hypothetical protein